MNEALKRWIESERTRVSATYQEDRNEEKAHGANRVLLNLEQWLKSQEPDITAIASQKRSAALREYGNRIRRA